MTAANRQEVATVGVSPGTSGPRRMLSEKQVLEIIPIGRTTLYRMEKAGRFPKSTYIGPTGAFGLRMRSSVGRTRLTNSIRSVAGAKDVAILLRTNKTYDVRARGKTGHRVCGG